LASGGRIRTVLLFAVPYDALPPLGRDLKEAIRGKIVLDACNPLLESIDNITKFESSLTLDN
jgi:predicted dinucleotide-binding enzyme